MKRNLNIKAKLRDGTAISDGKREMTFADFIVPALDLYGGGKSREIGALADRIEAARKPPKDVEITPGDAELIVAAIDARGYASFVRGQIAGYVEAK